jgi:hypothetical protein
LCDREGSTKPAAANPPLRLQLKCSVEPVDDRRFHKRERLPPATVHARCPAAISHRFVVVPNQHLPFLAESATDQLADGGFGNRRGDRRPAVAPIAIAGVKLRPASPLCQWDGRSPFTRTSHGQLPASSESGIYLVFALAAAAPLDEGSAKAISALPATSPLPPNSDATYSTPPISYTAAPVELAPPAPGTVRAS